MKKIFLKGFIASVAILSSVGYLSAAPTAIPTTDVSQEVSCEQFKNHGAKQ